MVFMGVDTGENMLGFPLLLGEEKKYLKNNERSEYVLGYFWVRSLCHSEVSVVFETSPQVQQIHFATLHNLICTFDLSYKGEVLRIKNTWITPGACLYVVGYVYYFFFGRFVSCVPFVVIGVTPIFVIRECISASLSCSEIVFVGVFC